MSAFPSLPLFTDAYFGDTKHLTCEEHGAYLQLLMIAWRTPGCCIPNDDAKIARMIGLTAKRWRTLKPTVMAFWTLDDDRVWRQSRLLKERRWVSERSAKRADAGKQGGRPKSLKNNDTTKANGSFSESKTKAPNPKPSKEEEEEGSVAKATGTVVPIKPQTPRERLWTEGRPALLALGVKERSAGEMMGKWLKDAGDDHSRVLDAILRARDMCPTGPIAWITASLKTDKPHAGKPESVQDAARALRQWANGGSPFDA